MTREEFFKNAGPHFLYMLNESSQKAWEGILPENGIKAFYRSDRKQNKDRTFTEAYVILTENYLIEVWVSANQISSTAHKFNTCNIYKSYKIINDLDRNAPEIEEVRIELREDKPEKILKKPSDYGDMADFKNFIKYLF